MARERPGEKADCVAARKHHREVEITAPGEFDRAAALLCTGTRRWQRAPPGLSKMTQAQDPKNFGRVHGRLSTAHASLTSVAYSGAELPTTLSAFCTFLCKFMNLHVFVQSSPTPPRTASPSHQLSTAYAAFGHEHAVPLLKHMLPNYGVVAIP